MTRHQLGTGGRPGCAGGETALSRSLPSLLVVDDEPAILDILDRFAAERGFEVVQCAGGQAAIDHLRDHRVDMAIVDVRMPDVNGLDVLRAIRKVAPDCAVVLMTGFAAVDTAVEAIKMGAIDYLSKPIDYGRLAPLLSTVREQTERRRRLLTIEGELVRQLEFHGMIGRGPAMEALFSLVRRLAPYARAALITGETGVGKELVARALHLLGPRKGRRLVTVNCSAIVPTLFESELFGHTRGAFTGATEAKAGLFEHADLGTLFLDEVAELPLSAQAKLLRVLETGEVQRIGSLETRHVDVHVLAATNRDLRVEAAAGRFRQDLYFRLNVVEIQVPPLRERREDIPHLVAAFTRQFAQRFHKNLTGASLAGERLLMAAPWEGNVRELRNVIERACMLAETPWITERDLTGVVTGASAGDPVAGSAVGQPDEGDSLRLVERDHLVRTLERVHGNKSRAAQLLGVSRWTLYRLMERHGLTPPIQRRMAGGDTGSNGVLNPGRMELGRTHEGIP